MGTNSYELFTLDKLINKLIVHLRIMAQVRKRALRGHVSDFATDFTPSE